MLKYSVSTTNNRRTRALKFPQQNQCNCYRLMKTGVLVLKSEGHKKSSSHQMICNGRYTLNHIQKIHVLQW